MEVDAEDEWNGDLARLVITLAATGGRFSQVTRMRVGDVQARERRLMIPVSRKGRGVKQQADSCRRARRRRRAGGARARDRRPSRS